MILFIFWSSLHYFSPTPTFSTHHASLLHHTKSSSCSPTKSIIFISALILPPPTPTLSFLLEQDLCNFMSTLFLQLGYTRTVCTISHRPRLNQLSEGDKWKVIPGKMEKTLDRLHFFCDSCASSFWCLVKSLLFTCGGGYKYLYTGNRSRQVRCTWWDEVMSLYPPVHLFKCLSRMIVIPPRSISRCLVTFSHYWLFFF